MKLTTSTLLVMLAGYGAAACSSDNSPSTSANGGSTSSASGGAANSSGGATTTATGGATTTASGGATTTTTGGSTSATSGGSTSAGGETTGANDYQPSCTGLVASGAEPTKGGACTATDPQKCFKTCGPQSVGFKSETCTAGAYAEGACEFPAEKDYSCFKIPATGIDHAACGATTPKASDTFDVPECTLCNDANSQYQDSTGAAKSGYCVCQPPNSSGVRKWTCASTTAWPCPLGKGC
jgi:hypothetical protein